MLIEFQAVGHAKEGADKLPTPARGTRDLTAGTDLRGQVVGIILDILSDSSPVRPEIREGLLKHLADNPGHPEKALLDHLRDPGLTSRDPCVVAGPGSPQQAISS